MDSQPGVPHAFSVNQVAKALNISRRTVYNMLASGKLHAIRIGARQRIPAEEIARLMAGRETATAAVTPSPAPVPPAAIVLDGALPGPPERRPALSELMAAASAQRRSSPD